MTHTISLYTVYHQPAHLIQNRYIKPIQVGNGAAISGILYRDNEGDHIADKNPFYCELTAQYWAWKNDLNADYIGMMHYRRFFNFNGEKEYADNRFGVIETESFTLNFTQQFGLEESAIEAQVLPYDIVLPQAWSVKNEGAKDLLTHYAYAPFHHKKDLMIARDVIAEIFPDYLSDFDCVMRQDSGYFTNMFILKKTLFADYSQWLFSILERVEKRIDFSRYQQQEQRVLGYLSERLFNVWIAQLLRNNPELKVNYLARVFVKNTEKKYWIAQKVCQKNAVSVVIAADEHYVPHLGALICSIIDHLSPDAFLDLIILDGGIDFISQKQLAHLLGKRGAIQFLDLSDEFTDQKVHMHFSRATFYRLILDKLIIDRKRVLYIDCDTIVLADLAELFATDLNGKAIGAVFDYIMHHFCQVGVRSIEFTNYLPAKKYLEDYVGLKENWQHYFQAGVILFDLEQLKALNYADKMIASLTEKRYWFLDQDILNKYFVGNVHFLNPCWNVVNVGADIYEGLSAELIAELKAAERAPAIIHYAGYEAKPWVDLSAKFAEFYYYYLRQTFWYESVLTSKMLLNVRKKSQKSGEKSWRWKIAYRIWLRLPIGIRKMLNGVKDYLKERL